jgi:hypothetical protein
MEIHLVSSLTPDDESRLAPRVLAAIGGVLDGLPVSYSVRIETATGIAIHQSHKARHAESADSAAAASTTSKLAVS